MEELEKQLKEIFVTFFRDTVGNRLNQWSWASFQNTVLKIIKDYKIEEKNKEVK